MSADGALVVGYGNTLRGDDGAGCRVAELLAADDRLDGADVRACHQLTPELATDVAAARVVVLVDARGDSRPGVVGVERVHPRPWPSGPGAHVLDPGGLVGLAVYVCGAVPPVFAVSVGGERFEEPDELSPAVTGVLAQVIDAVVDLVHRPSSRGRSADGGKSDVDDVADGAAVGAGALEDEDAFDGGEQEAGEAPH